MGVAPSPRPLEADEAVLANAIIGADTLAGGNVAVAEAASRFVADQYPLERVELPDAYHDERAQRLRDAGGANPELVEDVRSYVDDYGLLDARQRLADAFADAETPRKVFMDHAGECVEKMAKLAIAQAEGTELPPFDDRWQAAIGTAPKLTNTAELRERLRAALAGVGIEVGKKGTLREALDNWEHRIGVVPKSDFIPELQRELVDLLAHSRRELFAAAITNLDTDLATVPFDGLHISTFDEPDKSASGSSLYIGGRDEAGRPTMRSHLELNVGHPATKMGMKHLAAHEGIPGHYADSVLKDLMWTEGKVGFEAMVSSMCTRDVVLREGWAQNTLPALFGGAQQALDVLGPDFAVEMAVERLVDAAKNDGAILKQGHGMDVETLSKHLSVAHVLSPMFVRKILGWASHDLVGSMYAGAYLRGATTVEAAIKEHGVQKVAELCLHQRGFHDIDTFADALKEAA